MLPAPFAPASHADVYAYKSDTLDYHLNRRREDLLRLQAAYPATYNATRGAMSAADAWQTVFSRLEAHGVRAGPLGLELSPSATFPPRDADARAALHAALRLLVYAEGSSSVRPSQPLYTRANAGWAKLMWHADTRVLSNLPSASDAPPSAAAPPSAVPTADTPAPTPAAKPAAKQLLQSLLSDGFVQIADLGLNTTALTEQAYTALARDGVRSYRNDIVTSRARLPALEPLLHNTTLAHAVRGYLGGSARFDGYATFKLTAQATTQTYPSGWWHHDRCGRRLRMFVYVHDVALDGRPTLAARGSHNVLSYYSYLDNIALTRFSDAFVRKRHEVVPLVGRAGGGFLLDTNALHRAQLDGARERIAILLEWHGHNKIPSLAGHDAVMALPCPSIKSGPWSWTGGMPGWPLYPPDAGARPWRGHGGGRGRTVWARPTHRNRISTPPARPAAAARGGGHAAGAPGKAKGLGGAGRASPMAVSDAKRSRQHANNQSRKLDRAFRPLSSGGLSGHSARRFSLAAHARVALPDAAPPAARDEKMDAMAGRCFAQAKPQGCAAVYVVAPSPLQPQMRDAFLEMAAGSARTLRTHLPSARIVLILGVHHHPHHPADNKGTHQARPAPTTPLTTSTLNISSEGLSSHLLLAFDEIVPWSDPPLTALASQHVPHSGWLMKPAMIAATPYQRSLFLDADIAVEHPHIAALFALLAANDEPPSQMPPPTLPQMPPPTRPTPAPVGFIGAVEVPTSNSRRALGGERIYNSGVMGLNTAVAATSTLLARWQAWHVAIVCALHQMEESDPPGAPKSLSRAHQWHLATNDQHALARLLTPNRTHPSLVGLRRLTLSSRFNWRDRGSGGSALLTGATDGMGAAHALATSRDGPVVIRHDGTPKYNALRRHGRFTSRATPREEQEVRARMREAAEAAQRGLCALPREPL